MSSNSGGMLKDLVENTAHEVLFLFHVQVCNVHLGLLYSCVLWQSPEGFFWRIQSISHLLGLYSEKLLF